jgi:hypothetical protein
MMTIQKVRLAAALTMFLSCCLMTWFLASDSIGSNAVAAAARLPSSDCDDEPPLEPDEPPTHGVGGGCWVYVEVHCCSLGLCHIHADCKECDENEENCTEWSCPGLIDPMQSETVNTWLIRDEPGYLHRSNWDGAIRLCAYRRAMCSQVRGGCLLEEQTRYFSCLEYPTPDGNADCDPSPG